MFYLNVEHVLFIHSVIDEVFEEYSEPGELRGLRDPYLLESAVMQPRQTFDGVEIYPGLFDKAGVLLYGLTKNHPFVNGNKRTAFLSTSVFLLLNGYDLNMTEQQVVRMMRGIAYGRTRKTLSIELKKRAITLEALPNLTVKDSTMTRRKIRLLQKFAAKLKTNLEQ